METTEAKVQALPAVDPVYKFTKHASQFRVISWVTRALDKEDCRQSIDKLYSTGEELVGTDGKRLHAYRPSPLPAGFYQIVKRTKGEIQLCLLPPESYKYPDYVKMFPDVTAWRPGIAVSGALEAYSAYAQIIRALDEKETLNFYFLDDVLRDQGGFKVYVQKGDGKALYFESLGNEQENGLYRALVMPRKLA